MKLLEVKNVNKCYASTRILTDEMEYESNAVETVIEAWNRRADNG